jgi:two-component system, NarL family, nitrate/nitrite response regulator NarL
MASLVCIVHPSRIFREGLTAILAMSPFAPTCTAPSTEQVPSAITSGGEQVLLLIGAREAGNLSEALRVAKVKFSGAQIVVVGDANRHDLVTTALELGAATFIDENLPTSCLIKELELVTQGEPVISVFILKRLLGHYSAPEGGEMPTALIEPEPSAEDAEPSSNLSSRETAILNALVQGASNKIIAYRLSISEATVKVHVKAVLRKIQVRNRTQAAIWALHHQTLPKPVHETANVG